VNLELKEDYFWHKKLLNFKGYIISEGQQNPKLSRYTSASEKDKNAAIILEFDDNFHRSYARDNF
jgi:hypothetical protein